jgi:hypothetical protein
MKAAPSATINIITSTAKEDRRASYQQKAKACGHTHHCRCAIKLTRPNPFQKEIDKALNKNTGEA